MAEQTISLTTFSGAISQSQKIGLPGAGRFLKYLNPYQDPSYLTPWPKATKVSGTTVTNLVKWMEDGTPYDTNKWFYDEGGNIYKETSGFVWSLDRAVYSAANLAAGQGLKVFANFLYYATSNTIGRKGPLSGTPAYDDDFLSDGTTNIDRSQTLNGQTYTTPLAIAETAANKYTFTGATLLRYDPIKAISIHITAKGTGNWTLTLHDARNVVVATKTIANADLTNTALNVFTFATPARITIGDTYHFHVISSVADGTVTTGTTADLSTLTYTTTFGILIDDADWHPMQEIVNNLAIGNGNYIATWDTATYNPNKITLAPGFKVRAMTKDNEFLVAACWRGDSIDSVEEGRLYYWDGINTTFNFFKPITMGLPNAIYNADNKLYGIYGSIGQLFVGSEPFQNIHQIPKLAPKKTLEIYSGAITTWQRQLFIGVAGKTDDETSVEQGVYCYGNKYDAIPESLTFAFRISTGTTQSAGLHIGMVKGVGSALYISWCDNKVYGVDKVLTTDNASTTFAWESLIFDNGNPSKDKLALDLVIEFLPLISGETITPKWRKNRATSFTVGDTVSTVGATQARLQINDRFGEVEFGFNGTSTSTYPIITGVYFSFDDLALERNFRL